ncbi:MAG: hypothetical protein JKY15_08715 [Deltaproteobacteria bacterium]|nr:hypothetical protein [Deltaproteobacteria bacterium]
MKKLTFALLATFSINLFAHQEEASESTLPSSLLVAGAIAAALEVGTRKFGVPEDTARMGQLVTTIVSAGKLTKQPILTDLGLRIPVLLAASELAKNPMLRTAAENTPLGIGNKFKALDDTTKQTLLFALIYNQGLYKVYEWFRDETKVGNLVVHGG